MNENKIPENLKRLRKQKGLTLRALSARVGVTAAALSSYEHGDKTPSFNVLLALADFYGVNIYDILQRRVVVPEKDTGGAWGVFFEAYSVLAKEYGKEAVMSALKKFSDKHTVILALLKDGAIDSDDFDTMVKAMIEKAGGNA